MSDNKFKKDGAKIAVRGGSGVYAYVFDLKAIEQIDVEPSVDSDDITIEVRPMEVKAEFKLSDDDYERLLWWLFPMRMLYLRMQQWAAWWRGKDR